MSKNSDRSWKIRKGITGILTGILLTCLLAAGCMAAPESQRMPALEPGMTGSLKVCMKYTDPNTNTTKTMPGVEVQLVQVASVENEGGFAEYSLLEPYRQTGVSLAGMTAAQSNEAAVAMISLVEADKVKTAAADADGIAAFDGLEPGMYLVFQKEGANAPYLVDEIAVFLVQVPYPNLQEEGNVWQYQVEAYPKTELEGSYSNGRIRVKKQLYNLSDDLPMNPPKDQEVVFYVGLFTDAACTVRAYGTVDLPLRFWNNHTAEAVFENLATDKTYYIAETDGMGNKKENGYLGEQAYAAYYPNGQSVALTVQQPEGEIVFQNVTMELPREYYYSGTLTVTKKTVKNSQAYNTDRVFYAALFTDSGFKHRYSAVIPLEMNGNSSVSVPVEVSVGTTAGASVTYYVTETDENGKALGNSGQEFTFTVDKAGGKVTLSTDSPNAEIVITNDFTNTPPPSDSNGNNSSSSGSGPRTGDDAPIRTLLAMLLTSAFVMCIIVIKKGKRVER